MRASDVLGSSVVDAAGATIGTVRDIRVRRLASGTFRITGLVVANGRSAALAYAWGFVDGRAAGPWLLRTLLARAARRVRFVDAADVSEWRRGRIRVTKVSSSVSAVRRAK